MFHFLFISQHDSQIQAEIRHVRKRTAGIKGQRGQCRKYGVLKVSVCHRLLLFREVSKAFDAQSGIAQRRHDLFGPAFVRRSVQADYRGANGAQLFGGSHRIGATVYHALLDLPLKSSNPYHEKLVDIRADEREKHHAIERRISGVLRFFQHASLKLQKTQLTIDKQAGVVEGRSGLSGGFRYRGSAARWPARFGGCCL